jgi:glutamyl-tRNA reductase
MTNVGPDFNTEHRSCSLPVITSKHPPAQRVIIDRIHARADEIKQRELETAFSMLETHAELTDEQHAIIEELADALVAELLESPTTGLRKEYVTWSELQTAAELFLSSPSDEQQ